MDEQPREAELAGWVAASIEHRKFFRQRAKTAADQLSPEQIEGLNQYFVYPKLPRKPKETAGRFQGLGEWQSICQHAIFEIFYNRPDVTLNRVRQIAFGPYDWTQVRAIEILCRWANKEIIDREKTLREIVDFWPEMYDTAQDPSIRSLSLVTPTIPEVIEIIESYIYVYEDRTKFYPDLSAIEALGRLRPDDARSLLRRAIDNFEQEERDRHLNAASVERIRAHLMLSRMDPKDQELRKNLVQWSHSHQNANVRQDLALTLKQKPEDD